MLILLALRRINAAQLALRRSPSFRYFTTVGLIQKNANNKSVSTFKSQVFMSTERPELRRTALVGKVNSHLGEPVSLCGWITHIRMVGGGRIFIVLRDQSGSVQLLLTREHTKNFDLVSETLGKASSLEATVSASGIVASRPKSMINSEMMTGEVEVVVENFVMFNPASKLSFNPNLMPLPDEDIRLKHRFVDLRRDTLQYNIRLRAKANAAIREYLEQENFVEVETPLLFKSTPEGAREFLVPADRIKHGAKFALPQSPQQFKQMLMAAGFDRYFQIARCFRDEDLRADRQPEFTQLDMEMSFVTMEDVMGMIERLVKHLWEYTKNVKMAHPFPKITYFEALSRFGSDKPDLRYPFEILQLSRQGDQVIEALPLSMEACPSTFKTKDFDDEDWLSLEQSLPLNNIKICGSDQLAKLLNVQQGEDFSSPNSVLLVASRSTREHIGSTLLGKVRNHLIKRLEMKGLAQNYRTSEVAFLWVYDFPLLAKATTGGESPLTGQPSRMYESLHHPFTAPIAEDVHLLESDPLAVRGQHYDLVLDGCEIGGGSIRIHSADLQEYILRDIIKLPDNYTLHFSHLLEALRSGCPPHGGMALGLDRILAIICGANSIRDVIAFPKSSTGVDLCVRAPS